jgi:hypothetical protein
MSNCYEPNGFFTMNYFGDNLHRLKNREGNKRGEPLGRFDLAQAGGPHLFGNLLAQWTLANPLPLFNFA